MKKNGVMLVGLCGRSGSGKGYIAKMFAEYGIPSVDTDAVYRKMTSPAEDRSMLSPCMNELIARFGEQILSADLSLNRAVMRSLVFGGDKEALADLNRITHRHILEKTQETAEQYFRDGSPIVLIDAPVLYESGFDRMCERVVCVTAPEDVIVSRIMKRDGLSEEDAKKRLASQKTREELEDRADYVIFNDDERPVLYERVKRCTESLHAVRDEHYE
ncbi:MAG: dephospho-CoA kinase [Clostridia bacterium]|nr:dephospho-CoA kinase [Clostridia bacterium]